MVPVYLRMRGLSMTVLWCCVLIMWVSECGRSQQAGQRGAEQLQKEQTHDQDPHKTPQIQPPETPQGEAISELSRWVCASFLLFWACLFKRAHPCVFVMELMLKLMCFHVLTPPFSKIHESFYTCRLENIALLNLLSRFHVYLWNNFSDTPQRSISKL